MISRTLVPALLVTLLGALLWAASAQGLSNDGTATAEYSGTINESFVYQPAEPAVWQGTATITWDETDTYALSGRMENQPTATVMKRTLTISGSVSNTFAPPNQGLTCTGTLSARPGSPDPMTAGYGGHPLKFGVSANVPETGYFIQSSAPDASHCGSPPATGGPGFVPPLPFIEASVSAFPAMGEVTVPSEPLSISFPKTGVASGSDNQTTESLHALLQITTSGAATAGPSKPPKLTPAQVVAKRNALEALRETTQAALYPCSSTSVGTTLITSGLLGAVVGGTLLAIAGPLCASYYTMILAEINTIKDPPRSDFRTVARAAPVALGAGAGCGGRHGAALRLCKAAGHAASRLIAASRATARLARAVETTIDRESGAERAHSKSSAERQNRALISLSEQFRKARRAQTAAGAALARIIRSHGATVRMTAAQASAADQDLLSALSQRGLSVANRTFLAGLLKGRAFDVLAALGR
jgi:hypothetical protein